MEELFPTVLAPAPCDLEKDKVHLENELRGGQLANWNDIVAQTCSFTFTCECLSVLLAS